MKKLFTHVIIALLFGCLSASCARFEPQDKLSKKISWKTLNSSRSRPKGAYSTYISKEGIAYHAGDKLKLGRASIGDRFAFVKEMSVFGDYKPALVEVTSSETEIVSFRVGGNKRMGYRIWAKSKGVIGVYWYTIDFENAIDAGELLAFGLTSDQALSELKKAKDKLDLELISRERYEEIKKELSVYIK